MSRAPRSLLRTIAAWLVAVMIGAVVLSGLLLYWQFEGASVLNREQTLRGQVDLLAQAIKLGDDGKVSLALPAQTAALFDAYATHYAVIDEKGDLLASSSDLTAPLWPPGPLAESGAEPGPGFWPFIRHPRAEVFFVTKRLDGGLLHYGVSRATQIGGRQFWAQVASTDQEMLLDTEVEEYIDHVGWFWIPFIVLLLSVNLIVIHRGLRPLRLASLQAGRIGPNSISERLPLADMPREIHPLVEAVNHALDRVEAGYNAQRDFLADAAHELRTPLAVLKAHLTLLDDRTTATALLGDLGQMERLVAQLLDVARLDGMRVTEQDQTDLGALALDVAGYLAPLAIDRERVIELIDCGHPVPVRGVYDFLFRALRNVVENALAHSPPHGTVTIIVEDSAALVVRDQGPGIPEDQRHVIFERFWQGRRDRSDRHGGAGLGMAIVARTLREHGGTVEIADAEGGGTEVILRFPSGERAL
jgi:signal transduction histidine kinase